MQAQSLKMAKPEQVGMDSRHLMLTDSAVNEAVEKGHIPGAVLAVVRHGRMAYLRAFGKRQVYPSPEEMTTGTIFDLASCTKPTATAISVMQMIDRGKLRLYDPVEHYLPSFQNWKDPQTGDTETIRIIHLMTHTSGLPAYASVAALRDKHGSPCPDALKQHICEMKRLAAPATEFRYSCLNFITLQYIIEVITGQSLAQYVQQHIFAPLGMSHTAYMPPAEWRPLIAPTSKQEDGSVLRGEVHDPLARVINGGVSGNAGLFASAPDLAILCAALQNGGEWQGHRILSQRAVEMMRTVPQGFEQFGRALGWDVSSAYAGNRGDLLSLQTYGHTGFTGTSLVIDPVTDTSVILLINAVHLDEAQGTSRLRAVVANIVAASIIE